MRQVHDQDDDADSQGNEKRIRPDAGDNDHGADGRKDMSSDQIARLGQRQFVGTEQPNSRTAEALKEAISRGGPTMVVMR